MRVIPRAQMEMKVVRTRVEVRTRQKQQTVFKWRSICRILTLTWEDILMSPMSRDLGNKELRTGLTRRMDLGQMTRWILVMKPPGLRDTCLYLGLLQGHG